MTTYVSKYTTDFPRCDLMAVTSDCKRHMVEDHVDDLLPDFVSK